MDEDYKDIVSITFNKRVYHLNLAHYYDFGTCMLELFELVMASKIPSSLKKNYLLAIKTLYESCKDKTLTWELIRKNLYTTDFFDILSKYIDLDLGIEILEDLKDLCSHIKKLDEHNRILSEIDKSVVVEYEYFDDEQLEAEVAAEDDGEDTDDEIDYELQEINWDELFDPELEVELNSILVEMGDNK
jgi:hypothetical protein